MEYTVQKLSLLAGISSRTLRYYDEIDLLKPARINSSGYRIYGTKEVDRLQQILFYKELGVGLEQIKDILDNPNFDYLEALKDHKAKLLERKEQIDELIANVQKTIAKAEGDVIMKDKEKFNGFKQKMIDENEKKYGKEVREKYGDDFVDKSNTKFNGLSQEEFEKVNNLAEEIIETLKEAFKTGNPGGELGQKAAKLHKEWLCYYWPSYRKEAHAGLAQMYVADERFKAYYDKEQEGIAEFLRDAIVIFTKK